MGKLIFITGGARSGKTAYAISRAMEHEAPRLYIATAEALDVEMHERIARHKEERQGLGFDTLEAPLKVAASLEGVDKAYGAVLMDCLTLWLSNHMGNGSDVQDEGEALLDALRQMESTAYVVSNEVGMGIVPEGELARAFRDNAGWLNAMFARSADEAWMTVSGLPLRLK